MQDRFRFKVYYKPHNKVYNVICLNCDRQKEIIIEYNGSTALVEWKNCVILQCTGLRDENDKLIYEGDIIRVFHVSGTMQGDIFFDVVRWNNLRHRFDTENHGIIDEDDVLKAVGNIYENPELLEMK